MDMKTSTFTSPSSFPRFHPHVTLATVPAEFSVEALRQAIPAGQPIVPVTFKVVEVGDKYFMSIYTTVHQDGLLGELRTALIKTLGESTVPPKSHVSLFYIDDSEPEERTKMFDDLVKQHKIVDLDGDKVALGCSSAPGADPRAVISSFGGSEIWIALCDGPVETWTVEEKIKLS
ncbi:hypothetical protein BDW22DRAFT_1360579 [Trametopsis cervina]|nr:hypothetical protein BDW22DRAFT_1360579 [Trametopsis cervina]